MCQSLERLVATAKIIELIHQHNIPFDEKTRQSKSFNDVIKSV